MTLVQPPIKRRPPRKPKKKRTREPNEPISRRVDIFKQCKACGKLGHNKRSCKGERLGETPHCQALQIELVHLTR